MSGHTKGPWILETVQTSVGLCHKIGPFPWRNGKENHACVYDDYASATNPVTQELLANARLIVAAPELLDALQGMLEIYGVREEHMGREPFASSTEVDCCNQARAAIAKAKGEA